MSKSILIVDDSSMMRKMLKASLVSKGHIITGEAKNGFEAIEMYQRLKPDLVTMDITMRGMDGFTAAKRILVLDRNANIIFLSNLDKEKYQRETETIGVWGFINKHKVDEILRLIDKI